MVSPINSSSSRTGVIMQYVTDESGDGSGLMDIWFVALGELYSKLGELDNEEPPFSGLKMFCCCTAYPVSATDLGPWRTPHYIFRATTSDRIACFGTSALSNGAKVLMTVVRPGPAE